MSRKVAWTMQFPSQWEIIPAKRLFPESKERAQDVDQQLSATQDYGVIPQAEFIRLAGRRVVQLNQNFEMRKKVKIDDFVISMRSFQGGLERAWANGGIRSSYVVLRPEKYVRSDYYEYFFKSQDYIQALQSTANFIRDGQDINYQNFVLIDLPLPPPAEQIEISRFLNHETAKIDALIREQERLIALLQEKRQAVISHAVTKGLDPTNSSGTNLNSGSAAGPKGEGTDSPSNVPMKDSGVEWLGEVPAHWKVLKLNYIAVERCDGPFGSSIKSEHYVSSGVRVVRLKNIRSGWFNNDDAAYLDENYYKENIGRSDVKSGDLLIAGLGDEKNAVGRACVAPNSIEPAMVKADCFRFRLNTSVAAPEYFAYQLSSGAQFDAGYLSTGSTRQRIALLTMAGRVCVLPPKCEQTQIVKKIQTMESHIDQLVSFAKTSSLLLSERRSALISAAVTGKIDVRNWQPPADESVFEKEAQQSDMEAAS